MIYVTKNSTTVEAYHTDKDCPRLNEGNNKIELDKDNSLIDRLKCCSECNGTVNFDQSGQDGGLLQTVNWLERLLGDDVSPYEYLPLEQHTVNCEDPECVVCNDVLNHYRDVITPLYVHVEGEKIRQEVNHASD